MKPTKIFNNMKSNLRKRTFKLRKSSPQIAIAVGITGMVVGTVMACRATTKVPELIDEKYDEIDKIENGDGEEYKDLDENQKNWEIVKVKTMACVKIAWAFTPAVAIDIVSILAITKGAMIFKNRQAALCAAYATLDSGYKSYRQRVAETYGEDVDREMQYGIKKVGVKEKVTGEDGKTKTVKKTIDVLDNPNQYSMYARFFDEASPYWDKVPQYNQMFLQIKQNEFNVKLQAEGFVFLNDVYEALGLPKSRAGQIVGWLYDEDNPLGDNYIDFGMYDVNKPGARDFINGYERSILLDFNVDGPIIDYIDAEA